MIPAYMPLLRSFFREPVGFGVVHRAGDGGGRRRRERSRDAGAHGAHSGVGGAGQSGGRVDRLDPSGAAPGGGLGGGAVARRSRQRGRGRKIGGVLGPCSGLLAASADVGLRGPGRDGLGAPASRRGGENRQSRTSRRGGRSVVQTRRPGGPRSRREAVRPGKGRSSSPTSSIPPRRSRPITSTTLSLRATGRSCRVCSPARPPAPSRCARRRAWRRPSQGRKSRSSAPASFP